MVGHTAQNIAGTCRIPYLEGFISNNRQFALKKNICNGHVAHKLWEISDIGNNYA